MDIVATISSLLGNFGVNWTSFLGQLVTFVILLALLRLILYKPMISMLEERKARIAQGLKDADEAAKARAESEHQAADRLKEATAKAESLLEESRKAHASTMGRGRWSGWGIACSAEQGWQDLRRNLAA